MTKPLIVVALVCFIAGLLAGGTLGSTLFRPDTNKAVVKQLKKDDKKVEAIQQKEVIRYVTREKIKTVIQKVPDTSGCLDHPSPVLHTCVLNALNNERPAPDSGCAESPASGTVHAQDVLTSLN